jgi:hypothetical protein
MHHDTLKKIELLSSSFGLEVMSILYGSLLGDVHGERRVRQDGEEGNTRFTFKQGSPNVQYLLNN